MRAPGFRTLLSLLTPAPLLLSTTAASAAGIVVLEAGSTDGPSMTQSLTLTENGVGQPTLVLGDSDLPFVEFRSLHEGSVDVQTWTSDTPARVLGAIPGPDGGWFLRTADGEQMGSLVRLSAELDEMWRTSDTEFDARQIRGVYGGASGYLEWNDLRDRVLTFFFGVVSIAGSQAWSVHAAVFSENNGSAIRMLSDIGTPGSPQVAAVLNHPNSRFLFILNNPGVDMYFYDGNETVRQAALGDFDLSGRACVGSGLLGSSLLLATIPVDATEETTDLRLTRGDPSTGTFEWEIGLAGSVRWEETDTEGNRTELESPLGPPVRTMIGADYSIFVRFPTAVSGPIFVETVRTEDGAPLGMQRLETLGPWLVFDMRDLRLSEGASLLALDEEDETFVIARVDWDEAGEGDPGILAVDGVPIGESPAGDAGGAEGGGDGDAGGGGGDGAAEEDLAGGGADAREGGEGGGGGSDGGCCSVPSTRSHGAAWVPGAATLLAVAAGRRRR